MNGNRLPQLPFEIQDQYESLDDLYDLFSLPENLRMHMLRVAAFCEKISRHWTGPPLRLSEMRNVLLIHDVGNIIKMPPRRDDARFTKPSLKNIDILFDIFGEDDHALSEAVARGLKFPDSAIKLLNGKIFLNNEETFKHGDFSQKVCAYTDQRAAPNGIVTLEKRLNEALKRYKDKPGSSMNNPKTDKLIEYAHGIEAQIKEYIPKLLLSDIADNQMLSEINYFRSSNFPSFNNV